MEALESLAEMHKELPEVLETLNEAAFTDPDANVQLKAVEALGEVQAHEPAMRTLQRVVRTHPRPSVRIEAMETLAEIAEPRMVLDFVKELLDGDAPVEVKIEALEILDGLATDAGVPLLKQVAASRESVLREKAVELLEERKN